MAKTKPINRSRVLPEFIQVGKPASMPDGMTNFVRTTVIPMYRTMLKSVQVQSPRRLASARGAFSFKIESFRPDQARIALDMTCGGFARRAHIVALSSELSWYVLHELRNHPALAEDHTSNNTRCQTCHKQLQKPILEDACHNGVLVFAAGTLICDVCMLQELERRESLHHEAVEALFSTEFLNTDTDVSRTTTTGFLDELQDEVVRAESSQATKKSPWWRRRRK